MSTALRVSVTDVDAYRYWRGQEEASLEDLRDRLTRRSPSSPRMDVGRAVHAAIERAAVGDAIEDILLGDGSRIRVECDVPVEVLPARECPMSVSVVLASGQRVELRGRIDTTDGVEVHDFKTVGKFDPEALMESFQWRAYLWASGADRFVWHVFEVLDPLKWDPNVFRLNRYHRVEQFRYPALEHDCRLMLEEFVSVVAASVPEYLEMKTVTVDGD